MKTDLSPDQKKRAVIEFSAIEKRLDLVLFRRNDDDNDEFPLGTAAAVGAGALGTGVGVNALRVKGKTLNMMPQAREVNQVYGADESGFGQLGGRINQADKRAYTIRPNINVRPENRFVMSGTGPLTYPTRAGDMTLPGGPTVRTYADGASKGFLGDLKTGTGAFASEAKAGIGEGLESLSSMFKRLIGKGAVAAA